MLHENYCDKRLISEVSAYGQPISVEKLAKWSIEEWILSPTGKEGILFRDEDNILKFFHFCEDLPHIDRLFLVNHSPIYTELRTLHVQVLRTHYYRENPNFHFDLLIAERVSESSLSSSLVIQAKP